MQFNDFGVNLSKIRSKLGLSTYELSLRIDKDASYIHKVESGKINISLKTMLDICDALNIEPIELFKCE